jgi:hypothetical protein
MAIVAISQMTKAAIFVRAYEECRDRAGTVDYDCFGERQKHIFAAILAHMQENGYGATNRDLVLAFWQYAIDAEIDEGVSMALATSMFVTKLMDYLEPRS